MGVCCLAEHRGDGLEEDGIGLVGLRDPPQARAEREPSVGDRIEEAGADEVVHEPVRRRPGQIGVSADVADRRLTLLADDLQDQRQAFEMHAGVLPQLVPSCGNRRPPFSHTLAI